MATEYPQEVPDQHQEHQPGLEHEMIQEPIVIRKNYKGSEKLKGKKALITGGDSGIGRSVAVHFAREGADVAIVYLDEEQDAQDTRKLVEAEGQKCVLIPGDLRDENFCKQSVERAVQELGGLNILVNNAAEQHEKNDLREITSEQLEKTFKTNIFAYIYVAQAALNHLKEGDCIINTTSITSYRGSSHLMDYASTKGAITSFTRSLSQNLAEGGIRVNAVAPGPIWTPLIPATLEKVGDFGKDQPMGRLGQPAEVAPAYVFLASEDGSYITGQTIHVNGGEQIGG
ncbi:SDR family oxidoreductase [Rufibacter tibetensis]|uniref:Short-chain dehydrogenase n=1 Tax=Rufibacter tibetensis TaxID=512763 RepID=A0A0P0C2W8_9BACT|nr:SDR family oxidoreductase [Rufibacter tibetensis]ALI99050.1 short-chain dehydrogenase [Rufibacter tibetensis]